MEKKCKTKNNGSNKYYKNNSYISTGKYNESPNSWGKYRSSLPRCSVIKVFLKISQN